jgi:hypothetical protein
MLTLLFWFVWCWWFTQWINQVLPTGRYAPLVMHGIVLLLAALKALKLMDVL